MKILHLATFLQGGAGRVITELALEQRRAGHDVRLVASETAPVGYGNYQAYLHRLTAAGIPVRLADSLFERRHAANLAVVHVLDRTYEPGDEPDVIHAHAAIPSLVALTFAGARRATPRIVQTMHGWGGAKTAEQAATDVALLNLVDCVAVPSRGSFETLVAAGVDATRIVRVPYGVGRDEAEPDARDLALMSVMEERRREGALVVAAIGTIGARKRQTLLVDAAARTMGASPFLVFVGDGDDRELRTVVALSKLDERVHLHGYSAAARRIAQAADVVVLPSASEGQPLSVLEAFADRTLVVVSDIPELAELVDDGVTGFQSTSGDAQSLADVLDGIARLARPARDAITNRARRRYLEAFTLPVMVDSYAALYRPAGRDLVKHPKPRNWSAA